ncbi:glucans biosynthesis glucosyltransferase MdoH [Pelagovum pacificum]|uniref:Glucans biosynthesis glucosyltransferase H n=1 Tax=Pelagovum pacificum TaxID=2588711 RepID=A0A5C5GHX2_9RHOB|nr:glucans biosynthesis glucosyltransferase MdoH [Pelagovum pacificum]QQA43824.1 glucans biosynthesis glucosyltransferase MdoH [Pelagovum pacificum]TNY33046.1 glucans biosynthesis glucosyltransferase MdoH [Pelagovum pacificum]
MIKAPYDTWLSRAFAVVFSLGMAVAAVWLNRFNGSAGDGAFAQVAAVAIFGATFWLSWGAALVLIGLFPRRAIVTPVPVELDEDARCVVMVPVCNEDPVATFSRIAAMDAALEQHPEGHRFQFAILSDTSDELTATREERMFARLLEDREAEGRIFYRRRTENVGRKAGNLREFIETSGAAWDYALILDADSLMEPGTMVEMLRRMVAEPRLGLLQTLPVVVGASTLFGRVMQFGAAIYSPVYARGAARMQGETGPFWGHNAMIRIKAFAECCGLPALPGKPPFGGPILSHDYVEAALLARGGWIVRLDEDISGSYEESPANILEHSKRDRRWCQGNLQHARLIGAPKLRSWSRFVFLQGILAYVASIFWLGYLFATLAAAAMPETVNYFPVENWPAPVLPALQESKAMELAVGVIGLLLLPKILVLVEAVFSGRIRTFGGVGRTFLSSLAELGIACLIAPVLLMYQTRSILQILLGRDSGWPTGRAGDGSVSLSEAWNAAGWITLAGLILFVAAFAASPALVPWLVPIAAPMLFAPVIVARTSRPMTRRALFLTPAEVRPPAVMETQERIQSDWTAAMPRPSTTANGVAETPALAGGAAGVRHG